MLGRVVFGILMSGAIVGSALAQSAGGDYENMSVGNQRIVDVLYSSQQPIEGAPALTRDDVASLHSGDGWGVVFKDLKDSGYYPDAKTLGQVVGGARQQSPTNDTAGAPDGNRHTDARARDLGPEAVADRATRRAATRAKLRLARRVAQRNVVRRNQSRYRRRLRR